jgi:hypothetical protein
MKNKKFKARLAAFACIPTILLVGGGVPRKPK